MGESVLAEMHALAESLHSPARFDFAIDPPYYPPWEMQPDHTEIVRFGMTAADMPELAGYIAEGLNGSRSAAAIARDVTAFRGRFRELHFMR